jgi:antitoxin HigA-1
MTMIKNPVHPGTILQEDVLTPLGMSVSAAADRLGVSRVALSRVLNGRSAISAQLALRLEKAGAGQAETWVRLQASYDLWEARKSSVTNVQQLAA